MKIGGLVLCGGKSSRMGLPKATLPFGPETMLQRVVRLLSEVVQPLVVVAAEGQELPPLPAGVRIVRDQRPERGPLEGLAAGIRELAGEVDVLYATSCDVPLLQPRFVRRMIERLTDHDVAVPVEGPFHHPLAAVYRTSVLTVLERLLAVDRLRPVFLFDEVRTCRIPVDELREVDPELATLANLNRTEDYLRAVAAAGFTVPDAILAAFARKDISKQ